MHEAPQQGVVPHLAQGGHRADKIMLEFSEVPSMRCMGEDRVAALKCRAGPFSRSTCEAFSFCTSKKLSQQDTRHVLETFCNVSSKFTLVYSINSSECMSYSRLIRYPTHVLGTDRRSLNRKTFPTIRSGQWLQLSPTQ